MLISAAALVEGSTTMWLPADAPRHNVALFLSDGGWRGATWFVLTDEKGCRLYVYTCRLDAPGDGLPPSTICILSRACQPAPFLALIAAIVELARSGAAAVRAPLRLLCSGALQLPPPGMQLCVDLPGAGDAPCTFSSSALQPDALLWDGCVALGVGALLEAWHMLLTERQVLLLSDNAPLLSAACDALLVLLAPLPWEGSYVPSLPASLLGAIESPAPYLIGVSRRAFLVEVLPLPAPRTTSPPSLA